MKRACTQEFTKVDENLVCEFHVTFKNNYLHMKNRRTLSKIEQFQLFCLESYRYSKAVSGIEALTLFKQLNVFDYLADGYEVLHTQGKNYLLADINDFITQRKNNIELNLQ